MISENIGLDGFDCITSVPTYGLGIASALAIETAKPLSIYQTETEGLGHRQYLSLNEAGGIKSSAC